MNKHGKKSMEGIYSTSVNTSTLDESPMAYKPMESILDNIGDTVDVIDIIKPVYNFKAGDKKWKQQCSDEFHHVFQAGSNLPV